MSWRERLATAWQRLGPWLDRWVRPVALVAAVLLTAAVTAYGVVRLMMLASGHKETASGNWPANPPTVQPPSHPPPARTVETPEEAAEHYGGLLILGLSVGALLILVVAGLVVQSVIQDRRPADYFQPVGTRPMPAANLLEGYHWVDQNAGIVQIPIERAMDLLAQRGLPARSAADSQTFIDHGQGGPSDSSGGRAP